MCGTIQRLQIAVGEVYMADYAPISATPAAGLDLAALEEGGEVNTVISATSFETSLVQATGCYRGRELIWTGAVDIDRVAVNAEVSRLHRWRQISIVEP